MNVAVSAENGRHIPQHNVTIILRRKNPSARHPVHANQSLYFVSGYIGFLWISNEYKQFQNIFSKGRDGTVIKERTFRTDDHIANGNGYIRSKHEEAVSFTFYD